MQKNYLTFKFKAIVLLCLFVSINLSTAQNTSNYKYVITPFDTGWTGNFDVLEINNRYYVLTGGLNGDRAAIENRSDYQNIEDIGVVTVFDEELNPIEQFQLYADEINGVILYPTHFFYEENIFYVFGKYRSPNHCPIWEECFAKFDKNFNLLQPVTTFWYHLNDCDGGYGTRVLRTKKNEFIIQLEDIEKNSRLIHINSEGEILQDISIGGGVLAGTILETDSNYIISPWGSNNLCLLNKDSLNIYRFVRTESRGGFSDGIAIIINNQIICSYDQPSRHEECPKDQFGFPVSEDDRSIIIFDDNFKIKHFLEFGAPCVYDESVKMDCINPDSIYYAYRTDADIYPNFMRQGSTIGIANFSLDGKLNFNYTLDLPIDSGVFRDILFCKALSNGGVLIGGREGDYFGFYRKSFLLYYHPTMIVNNVKEHAANSVRQVFPNPAQTQFTVTNTENANLQLYNIVGQEVLRTYGKEENTVVNVDFLPQGMYVLKVLKGGVFSTHKIMINN
jgi:hypothetical protein